MWRIAKNHVKYYNQRWCVEKFIRTAKQHLGLGDCQSTSVKKQQAHIYLVMYAYAILEINRNYKRKKSVESVLHLIRRQKFLLKISRYFDLEEIFMA